MGGVDAASVALNCKPATVYSWQNRGFLPSRRVSEAFAYCQRQGVDISLEQLCAASLQLPPSDIMQNAECQPQPSDLVTPSSEKQLTGENSQNPRENSEEGEAA